MDHLYMAISLAGKMELNLEYYWLQVDEGGESLNDIFIELSEVIGEK